MFLLLTILTILASLAIILFVLDLMVGEKRGDILNPRYIFPFTSKVTRWMSGR